MTVPETLTLEGTEALGGDSEFAQLNTPGQWLGIGKAILLSSAYGIALGIGATQSHVLGLAVAVPLTFATSIAVAIPSLYVVLAMLEAPMSLGSLLNAASDAYRHSAITLGGLAPTLLLFSTSITEPHWVNFLGTCGLLLAATLGAYRLISATRIALAKEQSYLKLRHWAILIAFVGLSFQLAARFWSFAHSAFGGVS